MDLIFNIDLFVSGVAIIGIAVLGFLIFFNDRKSVTNRAFFALSIADILYNGFNTLTFQVLDPNMAIWILRVTIFFAVWHSFFSFHLLYTFPKKEWSMPRFYKLYLLPVTFFVALITLTPLVFQKVTEFNGGKISNVANGPLIPLFALYAFGVNFIAIVIFVRKMLKTAKENRKQFIYVLFGVSLTVILLLIFNLILPVVFTNSLFVSWGALFTLPFLFFTYYAIVRHKLMNIKVVSTEVLVFSILVSMLFEVVSAKDIVESIYKSSIFLLILSVGILLIRSVRQEVQQREQVQLMAQNLEKANLRLQELDRQKTEFLSIASHQLRTPLSIIKGYLELITDGAYGKASRQMKKILGFMDESNERLVKLVDDFLDISRIEQNRTKFVFDVSDINKLIDSVVQELQNKADEKKLGLEWKPTKTPLSVSMDEEKIRHVVFNFVDNAIKYSEKGTIKLTVEKENNGITFRADDNGIGFDKVDEANFFQKFYRGQNVKGTNVNGTGLGIYVTRKFIEKHHGRVWAMSDGLGKGSEFGFWIPIKQKKKMSDN